MRHLFVIGLLVAAVAVPAVALAQSSSTLPVSGTLTAAGTLGGTATIGGVTGKVTSSGGMWTMTVGGVTFASGTYSCSAGSCSYTGTIVGSKTAFNFTTNSKSGAIANATGFSTHGAWVSAVSHWAGAHQGALAAAGLSVGQIVSGAAKIEGGGHGGGNAGAHGGGNSAGHGK